jgi:hypothetical protein
MPAPHYILHARAYGVAVSAGLNGSATLRDATGEGTSFYRPIDEWILPGPNLLTGLIFQPTGGRLPDGERAGGPQARVLLEVLQADATGVPAPGIAPLATFQWPPPGLPPVLPAPILVPVPTPFSVATQLWQQAEQVKSLEDQDKVAIVALAEALVDALMDQDAARAISLLAMRLDDEARARGQDPAVARRAAADLVKAFARFDRRPPPLDPAAVVFSPVADGLAWSLQRGWMQPAILFEDREMEFALDLTVARIAGQWHIVRG